MNSIKQKSLKVHKELPLNYDERKTDFPWKKSKISSSELNICFSVNLFFSSSWFTLSGNVEVDWKKNIYRAKRNHFKHFNWMLSFFLLLTNFDCWAVHWKVFFWVEWQKKRWNYCCSVETEDDIYMNNRRKKNLKSLINSEGNWEENLVQNSAKSSFWVNPFI